MSSLDKVSQKDGNIMKHIINTSIKKNSKTSPANKDASTHVYLIGGFNPFEKY